MILVDGWRPKTLNAQRRIASTACRMRSRQAQRLRARLEITRQNAARVSLDGRLRCEYEVRVARAMPDMDNVAASFKPVGDALQDMGYFADDSQIEELVVRRRKVPRVVDEGFFVLLAEEP